MEHQQWYLAILACEHEDHPGHLLGRVCYIPPSQSGVPFLYPGYVHVILANANLFRVDHQEYWPCLFPLATLYGLKDTPLTCAVRIKTTLPLTGLRFPTRRTLSPWNGREFTINAQVKVSLHPTAHVATPIPDSACEFHPGDPGIVSWNDAIAWYAGLKRERVKLDAAGMETRIMDLSLDFAGTGAYFLRVSVRRLSNVLSDEGERTLVPGIDDDGPSIQGPGSVEVSDIGWGILGVTKL